MKTDPLTMHASENGSSGDKVLFLIKRLFCIIMIAYDILKIGIDRRNPISNP